MKFIKKIYHSLFSEYFRSKLRTNIRKSKSLFLTGDKVMCNCCGKAYNNFLPKGNVKKRENVMCPNCGSLERTRLLLFYLENETTFFNENTKILHFAPEEGLKNVFKKKKSKYINGDINPNLADEIIDITDIHYPDSSFDYIICSHVLGHVPDEKTAIKELYRVLKPGGQSIVLTLLNKRNVPTIENPQITNPEERLRIYGERSLVRLHGNDFKNRLEEPGFQVEIINYEKKLSQEKVERFRLQNNSRGTFFICKKR